MRALVTGATGFIGRHLVRQLLRSSNWEVHCTARRAINIDGVRVHDVDLTDYAGVKELFDNNQFDVVFHCAAIVKIGRKANDDMVSANLDMTHFIVKLMIEHGGLLVHVSSIAAMGVDNIAKCSAYGRSKFLSENEVWQGVTMGLKAVVIRPSVVVGVGGQIERVIRLIKRWGIFYTGGSTGFVDVVDVARVMEMVALDDKYWNKGWTVSGWNLSFRDFIRAFGGRAAFKLPACVAGAMLSERRNYDGSELGYNYTPLTDCANRIKNEL